MQHQQVKKRKLSTTTELKIAIIEQNEHMLCLALMIERRLEAYL